MLVNQNRVLLVVIAVAVGCLVNMPQMKLKDPRKKAGVFGVCLYLAYWFLNSQGLVEGADEDEDETEAEVDENELERAIDGLTYSEKEKSQMKVILAAEKAVEKAAEKAARKYRAAADKAAKDALGWEWRDASEAELKKADAGVKTYKAKKAAAQAKLATQRANCDLAGFAVTGDWAKQKKYCKDTGRGPWVASDWALAATWSRGGPFGDGSNESRKAGFAARSKLRKKHCAAGGSCKGADGSVDRILRCISPYVGEKYKNEHPKCIIPKCALGRPYSCK